MESQPAALLVDEGLRVDRLDGGELLGEELAESAEARVPAAELVV